MSNNPYEKIYDQLNITITQETTYEEAQQIAKHLGYIYNTFGIIVKDFISMLGYKFKGRHPQNSLNGNKKEKKSMLKDGKNDKKAKLDEKNAELQLEGKNKTAPHNRLIKKFQNYTSSGQSQRVLQQQLIKSKLLQLRQDKKNSQNQQNQKNGTLQMSEQQSNKNPQILQKISFRKKNNANMVINISSEDQQKEEDDANGVKTRAQLRGITRSYLRPESLLKRGRGKRGRPRRISRVSKDEQESSESIEQKSVKGNSYPLDPNDPFTIIYNVPYRSKNPESNSKENFEILNSKKQQKNEKKQQKLIESQNNSSQLISLQQEKILQKSFESEKGGHLHEDINFKKNFIDKVKASYMQQKQAIKNRLQNLDKEYKVVNQEGDKFEKSKRSQLQPDNDEEDEYEEMEEQQQLSQNRQRQFEDEQNLARQQEHQIQQQQEINKQAYNNQQHQEKIRNIVSQKMKQKQIHLQWLNNSIQKEFEENLRMNDQIHEDEYQEEVYLTEHQNDDMSLKDHPSQSINGNNQSQLEEIDDNNQQNEVQQQEMQVQQELNQKENQIYEHNQQADKKTSQFIQISSINEDNDKIVEQNHQYEVEFDNLIQQQQKQIHSQKAQQKNTNFINKNTDQEVLRVLQEFESDEYANIDNDQSMMTGNQHKSKSLNVNGTNESIPINNFIKKNVEQLQQNHIIKNLTQPQNPIQRDQKKGNSNDYMAYNKKTKPIQIIDLQ